MLRNRRVAEAMSNLDEPTRRVLELRFGFDGEQHTLESIGKELWISRERVRQLEASALTLLEAELAELAAASDELALSA